jgi:hypothetical protein
MLEQRVSPDGFLKLYVIEGDDGDISIGLENSFWHTHPECIAHKFGIGPRAITAYLEYLTSEESVYVIRRVAGETTAIFPTEDPQSEFRYKPLEEQLEFRRWSGNRVTIEAR